MGIGNIFFFNGNISNLHSPYRKIKRQKKIYLKYFCLKETVAWPNYRIHKMEDIRSLSVLKRTARENYQFSGWETNIIHSCLLRPWFKMSCCESNMQLSNKNIWSHFKIELFHVFNLNFFSIYNYPLPPGMWEHDRIADDKYCIQ